MAKKKREFTWEGIVKIQRSIFPNPDNVLIYDVFRNILFQSTISESLKEELGDELRIFCWAELKDGILTVYPNERFSEKEFKGMFDDND